MAWEKEQEAAIQASRLTPGVVLQMQRTLGNQHTIQALGVVQRQEPPEWDKRYGTRRTRPGALPYEEYMKRIGEKGEAEKYAPALKAASEWGGTKLGTVEFTSAELGQILLPEIPDQAAAHGARLDASLPGINAAFKTMMIDTVEAQADYLAHTAGESGTLTHLTEVGAEKRSYAPFQGRGPVQVTHREMYLQTLAYLETRIVQMEKELAQKEAQQKTQKEQNPDATNPQLDKEIKELREGLALAKEALLAIKANPEAAADPKYTFLFSAAYMHMAKGVRNTAQLGANEQFPGNEAEDRWVTGHRDPFEKTLVEARERKDAASINDMKSTIDRAKVKRETYGRAYSVLSAKAKANPAPQPQSGEAGGVY